MIFVMMTCLSHEHTLCYQCLRNDKFTVNGRVTRTSPWAKHYISLLCYHVRWQDLPLFVIITYVSVTYFDTLTRKPVCYQSLRYEDKFTVHGKVTRSSPWAKLYGPNSQRGFILNPWFILSPWTKINVIQCTTYM